MKQLSKSMDDHELEPFDRQQKKLSGTTLMLSDKAHRYVYKIIPEYTTSEAAFYCVVNNKELTVNSRSYTCLRETAKQPDELARHKVLPQFEGLVKIVQQKHVAAQNEGAEGRSNNIRYYEVMENLDTSKNVFNAIKLENLLHGYQNPAVIDIKLGMHNTLDNVQQTGLSSAKRIACVKKWQKLKMTHQSRSIGTKRLYNITATDLGLGEPFTSMAPRELHSLLKSWRQKMVAKQTTEDELGFRICSICIDSQDVPLEVSAVQAKLLKRDDTLDVLHKALATVPAVRRCLIDTLVKVRDWVKLQDFLSFSATSILITYDQADPSKCKVKWVDFTHVESIKHSPYPVLPGPSSMLKGIDTLIGICESAENNM
ncbi:uncharacterized protein BXIN_0456 [Babesia sp. Xinjiang]|uniref:uncharacterized protein n=1 Tax=Babesia sp. Xinjiang TaxID=462227 RepID=UPI000A21CBD4|nr:uncharacterized protein BXIN_0456 [Babesia sp. Xinjiang]ORM41121.1 hypothetical protein BXIN_0456 [Babesia sp. Xinjiang]